MAKRGEWLEIPYPVVREEIPVAFLSNSCSSATRL